MNNQDYLKRDLLDDEDIEELFVYNKECDGHAPFVRMNEQIYSALEFINGENESRIGSLMFSKCLRNVSKKEDENDKSKGKWSNIFSMDDIVHFAVIKSKINESSSSNIGKYIKILIDSHAFYQFSMPNPKDKRIPMSIFTYNRYIYLNDCFWSDEFKKHNVNFIVPLQICSLSNKASYRHAIYKMSEYRYNMLQSTHTYEEVVQEVKEAFCAQFLTDLITKASKSVRSQFISYKDSKKSPDAYVEYVFETANELPSYEGINFTRTFFSELKLPEYNLRNFQKLVSKKNSVKSSAKASFFYQERISSSLGEEKINKKSSSLSEENNEVSTAPEAENTDKFTAVGEEDIDNETGDNEMNINKLEQTEVVAYRKVNYIEEEKIEKNIIKMNETVRDEKTQESKVTVQIDIVGKETSYNESVNTDSKTDMALTPDDIAKKANSDWELMPHESPRRKTLQAKPKKDIDIQKKLAAQEKSKAKKEEVGAATIITSSKLFVEEYHKIVSKYVPGAKFLYKDKLLAEYAVADRLVDFLRLRGQLSERVLFGWMEYTAKKNNNFTGYFTVSLMDKCWKGGYEKIAPSKSQVEEYEKNKVVVPKFVKDLIFNQMEQAFINGIDDDIVTEICQYWGVVITSNYLATKIGLEASIETVRRCLINNTPILKDIFSMTKTYDSMTSDMKMSDWNKLYSELVIKAGTLKSISVNERDPHSIREFSDKIKGMIK
jgi:hypothetical protein